MGRSPCDGVAWCPPICTGSRPKWGTDPEALWPACRHLVNCGVAGSYPAPLPACSAPRPRGPMRGAAGGFRQRGARPRREATRGCGGIRPSVGGTRSKTAAHAIDRSALPNLSTSPDLVPTPRVPKTTSTLPRSSRSRQRDGDGRGRATARVFVWPMLRASAPLPCPCWGRYS